MRSRYSCAYIHFIFIFFGTWLISYAEAQAAGVELILSERLSKAGQGYKDGAIEVALFRRPQALAVADGRVLILDTGNHCLRRYDPATHQVASVAGRCETAGKLTASSAAAREFLFDTPTDLLATSDGLLVLDSGNARVVRIANDTATVLSWPNLSPALVAPYAMSLDSKNRLYVSDANYHGVARLDLNGAGAAWVAGTGHAGYDPTEKDAKKSAMRRPAGLALYEASGQTTLFVADSGNDQVRLLIPDTDDYTSMRPYAGAEDARIAQTAYGAAQRLALHKPYRLTTCGTAQSGSWVLLVTLPTRNQVAALTLDRAGSIKADAFDKTDPAPETLACAATGAVYGLRPDGVLALYSLIRN